MPRSKSDISNSAIRIFLQDVGKFYDEERGFEPFGPKVAQKDELLNFFKHQCCFCGEPIDRKSLSQDHLIAMHGDVFDTYFKVGLAILLDAYGTNHETTQFVP